MLVKDTEALERIQKRATKFDFGDYKARLVVKATSSDVFF